MMPKQKGEEIKIQEEASFFGSMDGAVKYVKGDATAGLLLPQSMSSAVSPWVYCGRIWILQRH